MEVDCETMIRWYLNGIGRGWWTGCQVGRILEVLYTLKKWKTTLEHVSLKITNDAAWQNRRNRTPQERAAEPLRNLSGIDAYNRSNSSCVHVFLVPDFIPQEYIFKTLGGKG